MRMNTAKRPNSGFKPPIYSTLDLQLYFLAIRTQYTGKANASASTVAVIESRRYCDNKNA